MPASPESPKKNLTLPLKVRLSLISKPPEGMGDLLGLESSTSFYERENFIHFLYPLTYLSLT